MQESVYKISKHVSYERVEEGTILMDLREGRYLSLNRVASDIWHHLARRSSIDSMLKDLATVYDVEPERAQEDIVSTLASWSSLGLIERCC